MGAIRDFLDTNFRHYNAGTLVDAAVAFDDHIRKGGKMFISLAGAMSTAELGISLAEMIRRDKIHGISCTGANLEEDVFNLVARKDYIEIPNYREQTSAQDTALAAKGMNRVTDTAIPEKAAMNPIEDRIIARWEQADRQGIQKFPHQFLYDLLASGDLKPHYQIDPDDSWLLAAQKKNLPIYVPGWEDSTLGNVYTSHCMAGKIKNVNTIKGGIQYMMHLAEWYTATTKKKTTIGFFQIGGGIAGDFAICAVPLLKLDAQPPRPVPLWGYFCQISDAVTSYGGYSGATPNEKCSWLKLDDKTPKFVIESDATICAPLIFAYVLNL